MGKILMIKGADFETNGNPLYAKEQNVLSQFQSNTLPLGTTIVLNANGSITTTSNQARVGVDKTLITTFVNNGVIKFKLKSSWTMALVCYKGDSWAGCDQNGTPHLNTLYSGRIDSSKEVLFSLSDWDTFAFNLAYTDETTNFTSTDLTNYFEYIKVAELNRLEYIKSVLESKYVEHKRYSIPAGSGYIDGAPNYSDNKRNGDGLVVADSLFVPFIVTPKTGMKVVCYQSGTSSSVYKTPAWSTDAYTYTDFATYPRIGMNLAYSDDRVIPTELTLWDFIDASLVTE